MKGYYKKQLYLLIGLFMLIIGTLTGCKQNSTTTQRDNVFEDTQQEDISTAEPQKEKGNSLMGSWGASVKDEKSHYEYNGDDVVIEYQYEAEGADSVGIMVLCDGVATPFHMEENEENAYLQCVGLENGVEIEEGVRKDINLYFTPYGKKGDTVSVKIIDIIDPAYDVTEGEKEDIIKDYQRGMKYQVSYIYGISIAMKADGINYEKDFYQKYSKKTIPDEDRYMYSMDEDADSMKELYVLGRVNEEDEQSLWQTVSQGEKLDVDFRYYGSASENVFTYICIDGELYPAFGGKEYVEFPADKMDDKHYTIVKGTIDTSGLEKGRHTVFAVCGNGQGGIHPFVLEVQ